mgnify:CR=1 FL=1
MHKILETLRDAQKALEVLLRPHPIQAEEIIADSSEATMVDLIVSGYEWICPTCDMPNTEIEATEHVTCWKCGKTFETHPPEHAYG